MFNISKSYRIPLLIAAVLHLLLVALMTMNMATHQYRWQADQAAASQPAIVNATAVDLTVLDRQVSKIKSEQAAKQHQEAERLRRLEQKALAYKQQRIAEERRLHEARVKQENLKQQQLAEAEALKRQQQKEQQARQKALEWNKKVSALKKKELAQQQEKLQQELLAQQIKAEQQQINHAAEQLRVGKENAVRMQGLLDKYRAQILQAIQNNWHPLVQDSQLSCQMLVYLGPGGVVTGVDLVKTSGDAALDRSARLAILRASPLPVPQDQALFDRFRQFRIKMSPQDIKGMS